MAADYKTMYLRLAGAASDALDALCQCDNLKASRLLREALLAAEETYIQTDDTREKP